MSTPTISDALFGPLTDTQRDVLAWVREFADRHIRPAAAHYDETETTPWPVIEEAAKAGLYSLDFFAEAMADEDGRLLPMVLEELAAADGGITLSLIGTSLAVAGIMANGTPEQMGEWLPRCFARPDGRVAVAAFCSSEPDAGSDVSALRTTATFDDATGEWVITGAKAWVTNGGIADVHVVVATVDVALGARGQASFIVPASEVAGLTQTAKERKHGIRASHTAQLALDGVRVPAGNVLGGPEKLQRRLERTRRGETSGGQAAMATFEASRPMVGAMALGIARGAYDVALEYAKTRHTFGKPIAGHQLIAAQLADMRTRIDAARLLVWRASYMARHNIPFTAGEGSMAKLVAGETAVAVTDAAIQILGGAGYTRDFPVERMHRDAKIFTLFEGTSEIQRLVIAGALTGIRVR